MKQSRIPRLGNTLARLMLGVAAMPQPDAMHPPRHAAAQPTDAALPPVQASSSPLVHASANPVIQAPTSPVAHAPSSPPLHLSQYLPIGSGAPSTLDGPALLSLGAKFVIVLVLLLVSLRVLKAIMPRGQGAGGKHAGIVLHSEHVGDKGRVLLLDLQTRLVLVGNHAGSMTPLTTVEDPEEVAALRNHYRGQPREAARERLRPVQASFAALLAQQAKPAPRAPQTSTPTVVMPALAQEALSRTRKLRAAPRKAQPEASVAPDRPAADQQEPSLATGDDALAHAITAMRALRQKVEQA